MSCAGIVTIKRQNVHPMAVTPDHTVSGFVIYQEFW
jgi:hypothetical protein